ncbi:hypothetical protein ACMD2_26782, partial [Ananas comosus]
LRRAGILGGIVASRGKYSKNINIIKALVELWCSETNTFHLPYGEVGISLWEIRELSGLPIIGDMYDEYIPPNSELYNKNNYPNCVRELFDVYQWLMARSSNKRVRQSVLPLRLGNKLHTQPYNPHRFARQFGFDQSFPEITRRRNRRTHATTVVQLTGGRIHKLANHPVAKSSHMPRQWFFSPWAAKSSHTPDTTLGCTPFPLGPSLVVPQTSADPPCQPSSSPRAAAATLAARGRIGQLGLRELPIPPLSPPHLGPPSPPPSDLGRSLVADPRHPGRRR